MRATYSAILWTLVFIGQLISVALFSWHLLAQIHFAYPLGYKLLNLEEHIAEYAPLNRFKTGFEQVSAQDHLRIFGEISEAIQHQGQGLAEISYQLKNGQEIALMHRAEIIHLQDVAALIDRFYWTGYISIALWLVAFFIIYQLRLSMPSPQRIALGFGTGMSLISLLVLILGPTKVFYWFHERIFPDGHQWFFYYQDSLMTTLMKAPDIFAFIAALLLSLLILLWSLSFWGMTRILNPIKPVPTNAINNSAITSPAPHKKNRKRSKK